MDVEDVIFAIPEGIELPVDLIAAILIDFRDAVQQLNWDLERFKMLSYLGDDVVALFFDVDMSRRVARGEVIDIEARCKSPLFVHQPLDNRQLEIEVLEFCYLGHSTSSCLGSMPRFSLASSFLVLITYPTAIVKTATPFHQTGNTRASPVYITIANR